jgi:hypothetical protein
MTRVGAQEPPPPQRMLRSQWDRWILAGQKEESTPRDWSLETIRIDSMVETLGQRVVYLSQANQAMGSVTFNSSGALESTTAAMHPPPPESVARMQSPERERFELARRFENMSQMDGRLWLAGTRFWPVTYAFHPERLAVGGRWRDEVAFTETDDDLRQEMGSARHSVITGDTVIDGQLLWMIRDSAQVRLLDRFPPTEREALRTREVVGIEIGRMAWDPVAQLPRWRDDSLLTTGTIRDSLPDGRLLVTTARYERYRHLRVLDSGAVRDTLYSWREAARPRHAPSPSAGLRPSLLLATGDTAAALRALAYSGLPYRTPMNVEEARLVVAVLSDPQRALQWGALSSFIEADTRSRMLGEVPALTPDSTRWRCEPTACGVIAAQWPSAREPELRYLALTARFALDPRRWADTILSRAGEDSIRLSSAAFLVRGVATTWEAGSRAPLPEPDASWQAWMEWMDGVNAAYVARFGNRPAFRMRFEESHLQAIRMRELLTGRNVASELQASLRSAPGDTARSVYRFLLTHLGVPQEPAELIAQRIRAGSSVDRSAAHREATTLLHSAPLADSSTTRTIQEMLLDAALEGRGPWAVPDSSGRPTMRQWSPRAGDSVFVKAHALHPALRTKWSGFGRMVTDTSWKPPIEQAPVSVYEISAVQRNGPLARVRFDFWYWTPGARAAPAPGAMATGYTIDLLETNTGWQIIGITQWIT